MNPAARTPRGLSEVPTSDLAGFANVTAILAFCANKPTHVGGAHKI